MTHLQEEKIKVGDCYINYALVGTGPHYVLCMPGTFGSFDTHFKQQIKCFDLEKFTLVGWDPPGFGKSRPPIRDFPIDMYERDAKYAMDLMTLLNIPKYSVLGWSGGGISSLVVAAKQTDAVRKMVVWGARSFLFAHEVDIVKSLKDTKNWSQVLLSRTLGLYGSELTAQYSSGWVAGVCDIYKLRGGNICDELLKDIICPTLLLHGRLDTVVDKSHPEHLHKSIKNSRLHYYANAGHTTPFRVGNDFDERIQAFFLEP